MDKAARLQVISTANVPLTDMHQPRKPLGTILLEMGAVTPENLMAAKTTSARHDVPLGDVLLSHKWVTQADLLHASAIQWGTCIADLVSLPPDPRLIDGIGAEQCLQQALIPWQRIGDETVIATAQPERFSIARASLEKHLGPCRMAIASEAEVHRAIIKCRRTVVARRAEASVPAHESCRHGTSRGIRGTEIVLIALFLIAVGIMVSPSGLFSVFFGWTILTLIASTTLKMCAAGAEIRASTRWRGKADLRGLPQVSAAVSPIHLPVISIMVPLFKEANIASRLIKRLEQLDYPHELLDIILVIEAVDDITPAAIAKIELPGWLRVVTVPDGPVRTKPRAMNYALHFCRGSIIGVYDAEDQPDPDQLQIVARTFAAAPPEVVCLQGVLDYYNPRTNWLARCFTIEYAVWFRAFLPGLARLGLVVPLGGTTLFFRRDVLDNLGAWDAWNVTEDADLGLRLARRGYRTALIPTVTHEEANCRPIPWVKQRSRWLKGFAITWAVHMRDPVQLWKDLGTARFLAIQALLLASFSQYLFAPLLWTCWLMLIGFSHPIQSILPQYGVIALMVLFIFSEVMNIAIAAWAVRGQEHRHLMCWTPTMHIYYPFGTFAGWKALYETVVKPFYWDKTSHGIFDEPSIAETATPPNHEEHNATSNVA